jgi:hypothetical protein
VRAHEGYAITENGCAVFPEINTGLALSAPNIGEARNFSAVFEVPPERAAYRAECSGTNDGRTQPVDATAG